MRNSLVSIIIVTYNSEKYILETLESAKIQTYKNIELIVSDDFSKDSTINVCERWIAENKARFVRTKLVIVPKNTGIPANCNRGLSYARGEWIKLIAGDDILLENCIESNMTYAKNLSAPSFIFSNGYTIDEDGHWLSRVTSDSKKFTLDSQEQYKELLKSAFVFTPSAFIRKDAFISLGGYNERMPLLEDYPMWLNATRNGYKLYHLDQETVLYRKHAESISGNRNKKNRKNENFRFMEMVVNLYDKQIIRDILKFRLYGLFFHIRLINKSYDAFTKGEFLKFHFYSTLRYLIPSFLLKTIIKKVKAIIS